jgi:acetyl-CoA carboxylase biotin carboxyl carrier protein
VTPPRGADDKQGHIMDLRKLKTLIDLVSESNIAELEITEAEGKVRIVKSGAAGSTMVATPAMVMAAPAAVPAGLAPTASAAAAPASTEAAADSGHVVKSPMVGTFYRSSTPGAKPMVDVGSTVKKGDALCIIEAMKIMNEIEADEDGVLTKVMVENGAAVEFGQGLFVIERRS